MDRNEIYRIFQRQALERLSEAEAAELLSHLGLPRSQLNLLFAHSGLLKSGQILCSELLQFVFEKESSREQAVQTEPAHLLEVNRSEVAGRWLKLWQSAQRRSGLQLATEALHLAQRWRCWVAPRPPGLYQLQVHKEVLGRMCLDREQYVVVDEKALEIISFRRNHAYSLCEDEAWQVKVSESPKTLYADLSCYKALDSCTLSKMPLSEISKLLPHTVKLCARPFTACLVGHYSQGSFGGPAAGNTWLESELNSLIISQDSKVRLFSRSIIFPTKAHRWQYEGERCGEAWEDYLQKSGASIQGHEEVSKVHQVHRGAWSLKLQMAPPRLEVIYPPLSLLELENGRFIDLSSWPCPRKPALLSTTRITEMGYIRQGAEECIVSFPGKYAHAWRSWDTSVACVFMCDELFGDHSPQCYCRQLYGSRGFRTFGYCNQEAFDLNSGLPCWGCSWFSRWRQNVEKAVEERQRLVVYFFGGQVGEGVVAWDDLPTADLWNGHGLGGSQKAEVAYLRRMGYDFEMRDVDDLSP